MTRICLVEDDRDIAKNLVLLLRSEGFAVTHAPTREEAFAAAEEHKFDLALIGTKGKWYDHKVSVSNPVKAEE